MIKKIAVLTLSILTVCAALAGCGSDDKNTSSSSNADSSAVSSENNSKDSSENADSKNKTAENSEKTDADNNAADDDNADNDEWGSEDTNNNIGEGAEAVTSENAAGIWVLENADADKDEWAAKYADMPTSSIVQFQLDKEGKGTVIGLAVDGKECPLTWSSDDETITISIDSSDNCDLSGDYKLKMGNGVLETDEMLNASCKFSKEDSFSIYDYDELKGLISDANI